MPTLIALIVDDLRVARWQAQALSTLGDDVEIVLLNCKNTRWPPRPFHHGLYHLLNIVSLTSAIRARVPVPSGLRIVERLAFDAVEEGKWQRLPTHVVEFLAQRKPSIAIKFGMGLLKVPDELSLPFLSYHHGDPRAFRGRPAGFHEILRGVPTIGQSVQMISNRLDGGQVVAFAETRVQPHSYRGTMAEAYRTSPLLLNAAIRNCLSGTVLPVLAEGDNYRLPSNVTVLRLCVKLMREKVKRLLYGAFFEKEWQVASVEAQIATLDDAAAAIGFSPNWRRVQLPAGYRFLADPFPLETGGIAVEALRRSDGQGEIVEVSESTARVLCSGLGHFSYPATLKYRDSWFLIPEVAEWSRPLVYRLNGDACELVGTLDIEGSPRLLDATLHATDDGVYLFANVASEGGAVLRLWTAPDPFARFIEHPSSPIHISPVGGRMAGAILKLGSRLYRLGQDNSRGYGERIIPFEIFDLSRSRYREARVGELSLKGLKGPHTFNIRGDRIFFDFYRDRYSLPAGIRRLRSAYAKRKALNNARSTADHY